MDLTTSVVSTQQAVLVTNVEYTVEEVGHHVPTAILQLRSRTADGSLVTTEVEGFRPYFGLLQSDFVGDALEVCNDRRVIGAEVDCSPSVWADTIGVDPDAVSARDIEQYLSDELDADIYHDPEPYTTIHDDPVARVFTREPGDVGGKTGIRADLDVDTFEADVPFVDRFLISSEIYQGARLDPDVDRVRYENWPGESDGRDCVQEIEAIDHRPDVTARMVVYDIEVATEDEGFPKPERAVHPITSISAYDSYRDEYRLWGLASDSWERDTETLTDDITAELRDRPDFPDDTAGGPTLADVTLFDDETQLLESFHSWVLACDPDIFTGYNCLPSDSKILLADGTEKPIEDVEIGDEVLGIDGDATEIGEVTNKWQSGVKQTKRVVTDSGTELEATADHRVLVGNEEEIAWKSVSDISSGEYLLRPKKTEATTTSTDLSEKELYLAGLVASDGTIEQNGGTKFYNTKTELHDQFPTENAVTHLHKGVKSQRVFTDRSRDEVRDLFESLGIPVGNKRTQEWDLSKIYQMSERHISAFLAGYMDGDGYISGSIGLSAENDTCSKWLQKLCKRIGVWSVPNERELIISRGSSGTFANAVSSWISHPEKYEQLAELEDTRSADDKIVPPCLVNEDLDDAPSEAVRRHNEYVKNGYNLRRHHCEMAESPRSEEYTDFVFEKINNISVVGENATYDIETSLSSFIADDVVVHNCDGFDHPYLIQRSYNVQALSIKRYTPTGNPGVWKETFEGNEQVNFSLSGRSTLDILDAYKKTQFRELDSYTLAAVADAELDYGKLDVDGDELDTAWHERPVEFYAYSVRDTQATVGIEREAGLIDLFENLRRVTGARYERAVNNGPMLDTLFLRRAYEKGLVLPSNTEPEETVFHGARVFDPVPGVHKNCVYPDLSSLYPSLFAMLNLGSETIIGGKSDLEESEYTEDDCYKFPTDERSFATVPKGEPIDHIDSDEYKGVKTPGGGLREMFDPQYDWQYVLKPEHNESFIRDTIDDLIDLKYQYKGEMYSAVKRVVNSCFTPDTEVMTPDGIVNIRNLTVGDSVYSINPDTMEVEVKSVTETIERPEYRGDLVNIQTQDIDLSVTPDHDLLLTSDRRKEDLWEVKEAENITEGMQYALPREWDVSHGSRVETVDISEYIDTGEYRADGGELQHTGSWQTYKSVFNADDFVRFIGWYVAEGTVSVIENPNGSTSYRITLTQTESSEYRKDIEDLLDRMGVNWYCSDDRHLCFYNKPLSRFLIEMCGRLSHTKRLPDFVWDISENQKRSLFDAMCNGDGDEDRDRYNTTSPDLRDDVCRLTLEFGNNPAYRTIEYDNDVRRDKYVIRYGNSKNIFVPKRTENDTADDGVYCVQVEDNHTLLAGRNGKFQWVPNCYGVMGDSASGGKGFRLYNRRVAEGITLAGRLTITHTAEQFTQYLQDNYDPDATLVGGDTDSATSSIPNAPDMETAWEWAHDAVEYVDASYDDFASETFDMPAEDHRLEVELESLASALFYMEGETDESYQQSDTGMLVKQEDTHGIRKRYAQAIVWDDDDGWIDTADPDEGYDEALSDPEDRSTVKTLETLDYDTFEDGPLDGMDPTDIVSITGFEYVRSDSAHITRDAQQQVLTHILFDPDPKDRIESYLTETVDAIEAGDVPLADLARPKGISQDLDEYGWKDVEELDDDDVTEAIEQQGGTWRQTPGPTYRGAKYADDWLPWEQLGPASKPRKIPIEKVRGDDYPQVYEYHSYPSDSARPDPPEVGRPVDAIAVSNPERLPDAFVVDTDTLIEKTLEDRLTDILDTMGYSYADLLGEGNQVGLDAFV